MRKYVLYGTKGGTILTWLLRWNEKDVTTTESSTLGDHSLQMLAYAMRVYTDPGKLGFFNRILD